MFSIHFTHPLGYLLLIPIGAFILWRQYRFPFHELPSPFAKPILFTLQFLALILLVINLLGIQVRRHQTVFLPPTIVVLRDQSGSFQNGKYLGIEKAYHEFENKIYEYARSNQFKLQVIDYIPEVKDYLNLARAIPNLKAIFLFTDGRFKSDSLKQFLSWPGPVYPVVLDSNVRTEINADAAMLNLKSTPGELDIRYQALGSVKNGARVKIVKAGKIIFEEKIELSEMSGVHHLKWLSEKTVVKNNDSTVVVITPGDAKENFNPYNDSVPLNVVGAQNLNSLYLIKPVSSLDEKSMVDILGASVETQIKFISLMELESLNLNTGDQIWMELSSLEELTLTQLQKFLALIKSTPAKLVFYLASKKSPGLFYQKIFPNIHLSWIQFSPNADMNVRNNSHLTSTFPDEVIKMNNLAHSPISAIKLDSTIEPFVEIRENSERGAFIGRINLFADKKALLFSLPPIWSELFKADVDYPMHQNIVAFIQSIYNYAEKELGTVAATVPFSKVYSQESLEFRQIGFDEKTLREWADKSSGQMVTSTLPSISNSELKEDQYQTFHLYNNFALFLSIVLLLSTSWALRKKWNLD